MAARIFLALSALIWIPYGLACFFQPGALADSAGVAFTSATGSTEIRAQYGGFTVALGALDGELSSYTGMALGLEFGTLALGLWLLRRASAQAA